MDIIKENKKIIILLLVILFIIILFVIWFPEKNVELSNYNEFSEQEVDARVSKLYGDELLYSFYANDNEKLVSKVSSDFLKYIDVTEDDYSNWLNSNGFNTTNVKFNKTTKHAYNDTTIYTIDCIFDEENKKINIIELYPEQWCYTIGTFIDFYNLAIEEKKDNYGAIINSIYQDLEYVQLDCSLYVDNNSQNHIDVTKSDSVKLNLSNKKSFIMATNNINFEEKIVDNKKYVNFKCIFNLPIDSQSTITSISFSGFSINGQDVSLDIKWIK